MRRFARGLVLASLMLVTAMLTGRLYSYPLWEEEYEEGPTVENPAGPLFPPAYWLNWYPVDTERAVIIVCPNKLSSPHVVPRLHKRVEDDNGRTLFVYTAACRSV